MTRICLTTSKAQKLRKALRAAEEAVFEKRETGAGKRVLVDEIDDLRRAAHQLLLYIDEEEMRVREIKRRRHDFAQMAAAV